MLKVNDPTSMTVPGSRWPITLKKPDAARPQTTSYNLPSFKPPALISTSSSTSRRKPRITYQSPDAGAPLSVPSSTSSSRSSASISPTSSTLSLNGCSFFTPAKPLFKLQPALPSYHPLSPGQLLLAAEARADAAARRRAAARADSAQDNASIDGDAPNNQHTAGSATGADDDMDARRSSSRTRRPVAKLREGVEAEAEDGASNAGTESVVGGKSPTGNKRRRTAGGGGSRKKKKEPSGPPAEPYPPRRERQRRGAAQAAAAALASSAEALSAALEEDAMEVDEAASAAASAVPDAETELAQEDETKSAAGASEPAVDLNDQVTPSTGPVRPKRASRPKRGRMTSSTSVAKDETPAPPQSTSMRTTRGSAKRRGSSASGSEASTSTSTGSAAPIAETLAARRINRAKDAGKAKDKGNKGGANNVDEAETASKKDADNGESEDRKIETHKDTEEGEVKEETAMPIDPSLSITAISNPDLATDISQPTMDADVPIAESAPVAA